MGCSFLVCCSVEILPRKFAKNVLNKCWYKKKIFNSKSRKGLDIYVSEGDLTDFWVGGSVQSHLWRQFQSLSLLGFFQSSDERFGNTWLPHLIWVCTTNQAGESFLYHFSSSAENSSLISQHCVIGQHNWPLLSSFPCNEANSSKSVLV